ncbi:MAG: LysR family transcriptional regulator [Scytonema sp. PMC 1070.18]|nr:LysR family transcriptional regulator [Scytonema sp. PMC 1070.18]
MELRHLRYFLTVAEELNFTRAADRLHIAQPPLSQQISDLEAELEVKLFDRSKRPLQLTKAGQEFLKETRSILSQVEQATRLVQRANRGEIGRLVVGFNSAATQSVLPDILARFRDRYPNVEIVLREMDSFHQIQSLHNHQIDCGFLHAQNLNSHNLSSLSVFTEPVVVALPMSHHLAKNLLIPLRELAEESFILPPDHMGQGFYGQIVALCQLAGFTPKVVQEAVWLQTVLGLVAGGVGVAIVPASMQNLQRKGVVYKDLQDETFEIETALVWRHDDTSPVLQSFVKVADNQE